MATSMMKQRLIGAAVLIALGVIFIPMLLTGEGSFLSDDMESNVPKKPMYELQAPKVLPLDKRTEQAGEPVGEPAPAVEKSDTAKVESGGEETDKSGKVASTAAEADVKQEPVKESEKPAETASTAEKTADPQQSKEAKKSDEKSAGAGGAEPATKTTTAAKSSSVPTPAAEKPAAAPPAATTPVKTEQKKPIVSGWVVQLGSFSVQKNALNLRDKLRKNGHASFVEEYKHNGKTSFRVRVGPELTRELANELKKKLKAETKIDGFVIEFPGGK